MTLANGPVAGRGEAPEPARSGRWRATLLVLASASLLLGAIFGRHGLLEARQYRLERDRLAAEMRELQARNAALLAEIESLRTDPLAVERIAREELGWVRPGEKLILLGAPVRHDTPVVSTVPGLDAPAERR